MHSPIIISNTKSYVNSLKDFFAIQNKIWENLNKENYKYFVAVPNPIINQIKNENYKAFDVGAQNFTEIENGAQTGGVTIQNIKDAGAKSVILGHSEIRALGETNEEISEKVKKSLQENIYVVLCIGEKDRDIKDTNEETKYADDLCKMLNQSLKNVDKNFIEKLIIAYEPVWAIGSGYSASTEAVLEANILIRRELAKMFGLDYAKKVKLIYGGSVDENNAKKYLKDATCDGVLVGKASLDAKVFSKIINSLYEI